MFRYKKHSFETLMQLLVVVLALTATAKLLVSFPSTLLEPAFAQSQSPSPIPLPESLPNGTTVKVDGSSSMRVINEALRKRFEQKYPGTKVDLASGGTDGALAALQRGDINLAAVGRPLTTQEKAQGLVFIPISREKIAIIVGSDNPLKQNLTFEQFAKMFRGEITDWSQVGGEPGKIRFIDHPDWGDTRRSLSTYDIFKKAPFKNGANATRLSQDDTATIVQALGKDGISYAIADQVLNLPNVRVIPMHKTMPDDPRYPYSQPRGYVYRKESATPGLLAFLGFATSAPGQEIVAAAKQQETEVVRQSTTIAPTPARSPGVTDSSPSPAATTQTALVPTSTSDASDRGFPWWLLLLVGIPLLGLLWWLLKRDRGSRAAAIDAGTTSTMVNPKIAHQNQAITNLGVQQIQTDLDQRIDSMVNLKIAHQTQEITNLVVQQMQTDLDQRIDSMVNLKIAHQNQEITNLVQQMQTDLDQRINSMVNLKIAHQNQEITNLVQHTQTDIDQRINSMVNLKIAHQNQDITNLVVQQIQTDLDQRINTESITTTILSDIKKQQSYIDMQSLKAEMDNFYARLEQFETHLYLRINQGDTLLYEWTLEQLVALQNCLTDRQALIEVFESFNARIQTELDNAQYVNPSRFTPWVGMGVQPQQLPES